MTVSSTADRETFQGNGVTTLFPLPFRFFNNADIVARLVNNATQANTLLTLGIDYTLSGAGEPEVEGNPVSSITMLTAPAAGFSLFVQRVMSPEQPTDIINQGRFLPEIHEIVFDRLTMLIQQALGVLGSAMTKPAGANYYDALGYIIKNLPDPVDPQDATNKRWIEEYVGSILQTGQGPINNAANVIYAPPFGPVTNVGAELSRVGDVISRLNSFELIPYSTSISLDASEISFYVLTLTGNVNSFSITGAEPGKFCTITLMVTQDSLGGRSLQLPPNFFLQTGIQTLLSGAANSTTIIKFETVDAGGTWLVRRVSDYQTIREFSLPIVTDENFTFNNEGDSTSGWTAADMTLSLVSGSLRATKTNAAGNGAQISRSLTTPSSDYIWYMKVRSSAGFAVSLLNTAGDRFYSFWINATDQGSPVTNRVAISGFNGSTRTGANFDTGVDLGSEWTDVAINFDAKFGSLALYFRNKTTGLFDMKARVACTAQSLNTLVIRSLSSVAAGSFIDVDFVSVCRPNFAMISDSIGEGKTLFSPNLSLNLNNYQSTWMAHAKIYQGLRNNFVVNKGVGGNTSAQMLSRITDVTGIGAKVVFAHVSSNDVGGVPQSTHTANTQSIINAINQSGAQTVLLNAMYGALVGDNAQPTTRDYHKTWWEQSMPTLTGVSTTINIMAPISTADSYMAASYTQPDGIHPNISGHTLIGEYIQRGA